MVSDLKSDTIIFEIRPLDLPLTGVPANYLQIFIV